MDRNKLLLLKTKKEKYYIRKNSWKYITCKFFCNVDENNQITSYGLWGKNGIYIISKKCNNLKLLKIIGKNKIQKLKDKDRYLLYCIRDSILLSEPVVLDKKVHGLRYADQGETELINNRIVYDLIIRNKVTFKDILYNNENYNKIYGFCMEHDLQNALFYLIENNKLYSKR